MRWLDFDRKPRLPAATELALLRKAVAARPGEARLALSLAEMHMRLGDFANALDTLDGIGPPDRDSRLVLARLAVCRLKLGQYETALDACRRGDAHEPSAAIAFYRGQILAALRRFEESRASFRSALALGDQHLSALKALLAPLAVEPDGANLLEFCEELAPRYRETALVRAHRAIALSRLGRSRAALDLVDLDNHVAHVAFAPPATFGGPEQFHRTLAEEILRDFARVPQYDEGFDIAYSLPTENRPAMSALLDFIRASMIAYIDEFPRRGLAAVMPPAPEAATLMGSTNVLTANGTNGEHIHATGYVSAVYHVRIPRSIADADDQRGTLALGKCDTYTGGYRPCWGVRYQKPVAGWLTVFPSHLYHDTIPSLTDEPRISVAADLTPIPATNQ